MQTLALLHGLTALNDEEWPKKDQEKTSHTRPQKFRENWSISSVFHIVMCHQLMSCFIYTAQDNCEKEKKWTKTLRFQVFAWNLYTEPNFFKLIMARCASVRRSLRLSSASDTSRFSTVRNLPMWNFYSCLILAWHETTFWGFTVGLSQTFKDASGWGLQHRKRGVPSKPTFFDTTIANRKWCVICTRDDPKRELRKSVLKLQS